MGAWLQQLLSQCHSNVVIVVLAAKLARIVWAVLPYSRSFDREVLTIA